jgi:hypothetical protein
MFESGISVGLECALDTLKEEETGLKAQKRVLMEEIRVKVMEQSKKEANPQYVVGSYRRATEEDIATIGGKRKSGFVGNIICKTCGKERTVYMSDAHQTCLCVTCKKVVNKAREREKNAKKRLESTSKEVLESQIANLQAQLGLLKVAA